MKSRELAERAKRAIGEGATPLEVMLDAMRFYHAEAERLTEQLLAEGVPQVGSAAGGDRAKKSHTQAFREMIELRKRAGQAAARAAPFVHPRMGYAVSEVDNDEDFVPLAERIAYYERRDDLNGVSEKAIEQNYQDDQSIRTSGSELPPSVDEDEL